ncbi:methylenetetrahydrofolate reductase [bacterium]|nr:methylenetetrahydrofolate reductase [bacterium]
MTPELGFLPDIKLTDFLKQHTFTLSAEVIPPRNGAEQALVLGQIHRLIQSGAQFLAVTKGAGGSLRGGSLPIAQSIKERFGVPCIAHFTCRDLAAEEVENQLVDHHYFGIRNILALRGDPPDGQPNWKPREGGYQYAHELIAQIRNLNQGQYLSRVGGPSVTPGSQIATDFCIGAAVYPDHPNEIERIDYFKAKIDAGAHFGITDILLDVDAFKRFQDLCGKNGLTRIPILPGSRLLKTQAQALKMMTKFKVKIPKQVFDSLPESSESMPEEEILKRSVDRFLGFTEELRKAGAPGIHLFVIVDTEGACRALKRLVSH